MKRWVVPLTVAALLAGLAGVLAVFSTPRPMTYSDRLYLQRIACESAAQCVWAAIMNETTASCEGTPAPDVDTARIRSLAKEAAEACSFSAWRIHGWLYVNGNVEAWDMVDPSVMLVVVHDVGDEADGLPAHTFGINGASENKPRVVGDLPEWAFATPGCCRMALEHGRVMD